RLELIGPEDHVAARAMHGLSERRSPSAAAKDANALKGLAKGGCSCCVFGVRAHDPVPPPCGQCPPVALPAFGFWIVSPVVAPERRPCKGAQRDFPVLLRLALS